MSDTEIHLRRGDLHAAMRLTGRAKMAAVLTVCSAHRDCVERYDVEMQRSGEEIVVLGIEDGQRRAADDDGDHDDGRKRQRAEAAQQDDDAMARHCEAQLDDLRQRRALGGDGGGLGFREDMVGTVRPATKADEAGDEAGAGTGPDCDDKA